VERWEQNYRFIIVFAVGKKNQHRVTEIQRYTESENKHYVFVSADLSLVDEQAVANISKLP
jgi:hypothetical protein